MELILKRHHHTRWGVDGTLSIRGHRVCDTVEHPHLHLPTGRYEIVWQRTKKCRRKMPTIRSLPTKAPLLTPNSSLLTHAHGPFLCTDGSICVGKRYMDGVLLYSNDTFARLYERLEKCVKRKEQIILTIRE